jgi:hypothetical protein
MEKEDSSEKKEKPHKTDSVRQDKYWGTSPEILFNRNFGYWGNSI